MYCKKCGHEIDNNSVFCNKCGTKQVNKKLNIKNHIFTIIIILSMIPTIILIGIQIYEINKTINKDTIDTNSSENIQTNKNTSSDDYMRQAGIEDFEIIQQGNYPNSIDYIIIAKRDIFDLEIELIEYTKDGTYVRTEYFNIGNMKKADSYVLELDISNYTTSQINNIGAVYIKVVGGTTSSLTVIPVA